MDPNATVDRIVEALQDGDDDELYDAMMMLSSWVANGGFLPDYEHLKRWVVALLTCHV